jgi:hypothetical protein
LAHENADSKAEEGAQEQHKKVEMEHGADNQPRPESTQQKQQRNSGRPHPWRAERMDGNCGRQWGIDERRCTGGLGNDRQMQVVFERGETASQQGSDLFSSAAA